MASTLGMPVATATRVQAAAATTLEAVHRLDNEIIVPVLTSESLSLGLCKVCSAERLQARAKGRLQYMDSRARAKMGGDADSPRGRI